MRSGPQTTRDTHTVKIMLSDCFLDAISAFVAHGGECPLKLNTDHDHPWGIFPSLIVPEGGSYYEDERRLKSMHILLQQKPMILSFWINGESLMQLAKDTGDQKAVEVINSHIPRKNMEIEP